MALACSLVGHKWDHCKCSRCGEIETREIAPLDHVHDLVHHDAKAPTCTEAG